MNTLSGTCLSYASFTTTTLWLPPKNNTPQQVAVKDIILSNSSYQNLKQYSVSWCNKIVYLISLPLVSIILSKCNHSYRIGLRNANRLSEQSRTQAFLTNRKLDNTPISEMHFTKRSYISITRFTIYDSKTWWYSSHGSAAINQHKHYFLNVNLLTYKWQMF